MLACVCVCFRSVPKGTVFYFPIKDKAGTVYCLKGADGKDFVLATRINQSSLHFLTRNAGIGQVSACALPVLFSAQLQLNLSIRARFGRNRETNEIKQPSWQLKFAHPTLFMDKCLKGTNIYWALLLVKTALHLYGIVHLNLETTVQRKIQGTCGKNAIK